MKVEDLGFTRRSDESILGLLEAASRTDLYPDSLFSGRSNPTLLHSQGSSLPFGGPSYQEESIAPPFMVQLARASQEQKWFIKGPLTLPDGENNIIYGPPGAGKSTFVLHLAACLALGHAFQGVAVPQRHVYFLECERSPAQTLRKAASMIEGLGFDLSHRTVQDSLNTYFHLVDSRGRTIPAMQDDLRELVEGNGPGLVIVDGWMRAFEGTNTDNKDVAANYRELTKICRLDCTTLTVAHTSHSGEGHAREQGTIPPPGGTQQVVAGPATAYYFNGKVMQLYKDNYGLPKERWYVEGEACGDGVLFKLSVEQPRPGRKLPTEERPNSLNARKVDFKAATLKQLEASEEGLTTAALKSHFARETGLTGRWVGEKIKPVIAELKASGTVIGRSGNNGTELLRLMRKPT